MVGACCIWEELGILQMAGTFITPIKWETHALNSSSPSCQAGTNSGLTKNNIWDGQKGFVKTYLPAVFVKSEFAKDWQRTLGPTDNLFKYLSLFGLSVSQDRNPPTVWQSMNITTGSNCQKGSTVNFLLVMLLLWPNNCTWPHMIAWIVQTDQIPSPMLHMILCWIYIKFTFYSKLIL